MSKGTQGGHRVKLAAIALARTLPLIQSWVPSQGTSPADAEVPRALARTAGCQEILAPSALLFFLHETPDVPSDIPESSHNQPPARTAVHGVQP